MMLPRDKGQGETSESVKAAKTKLLLLFDPYHVEEVLPQPPPRRTPLTFQHLMRGESAGIRHESNDVMTEDNEYPDYFTDARKRIDARCRGLWEHLLGIARLNDDYIKDDIKQLGTDGKQTQLEEELHDPLDKFLNKISVAVVDYAKSLDVKHSFCANGTISWRRDHTRQPSGDYMNDQLLPDRRAVVVDNFEPTLPIPRSKDPECWQRLAGVGEDKRKLNKKMGQLKTYAETHCKYRIDYPTVRGFMIDTVSIKGQTGQRKARVRLTAMNARGFWSSPDQDFDKLEVWIAYVCEMYEALASRISSIQPVIAEDEIFIKFNMLQEEKVVASLYSKKPPGRRTFIGFALDIIRDPTSTEAISDAALIEAYRTKPPSRVMKSSWLDSTHKCHELRMYEVAHGTGKWLPGLARHEDGLRVDEALVKNPAKPELRALYPEVTSLLSFGEPLSECKTPRQLFEVIYDACLSEHVIFHFAFPLLNLLQRSRICISRACYIVTSLAGTSCATRFTMMGPVTGWNPRADGALTMCCKCRGSRKNDCSHQVQQAQ